MDNSLCRQFDSVACVCESARNEKRSNTGQHQEYYIFCGAYPVCGFRLWYGVVVGNSTDRQTRGCYSKNEQQPPFLLCGVSFRQGQGKWQSHP